MIGEELLFEKFSSMFKRLRDNVIYITAGCDKCGIEFSFKIDHDYYNISEKDSICCPVCRSELSRIRFKNNDKGSM